MKRHLARAAALSVGLALVTGSVTACSSPSDDNTISVWLPPFASDSSPKDDLETWNDIVAPFEEEKGVDVEITIVPWESFEERFLTGFSSGDGPDLGYMYAEMIGDYISRGQLASFEPYITDEQRSSYYFLDQGKYDGEQYGLPIVVGGARVLYYNQAVLDAAGVTELPVTWDDFTAAAEQVKASGATPFLMAWGEPGVGIMAANYFPFLWQAGGEIINADGTAAAFNSEAGLKAAEFLYDLRFTDGILGENTTAMNQDELISQFSSGNVGFVMGPEADAATYRDAGLDFGVIPSLKDKEEGAFVAADVLVMAQTAADKELVSELAAFMLSGDSMAQFHEIAAYPPISSDEPYSGDELFEELYTTNAGILHQYPVVPNSSILYTTLYENLQQVMLGTKTPEQALQEAADVADASLSQNAQ